MKIAKKCEFIKLAGKKRKKKSEPSKKISLPKGALLISGTLREEGSSGRSYSGLRVILPTNRLLRSGSRHEVRLLKFDRLVFGFMDLEEHEENGYEGLTEKKKGTVVFNLESVDDSNSVSKNTAMMNKSKNKKKLLMRFYTQNQHVRPKSLENSLR
jgi:hypothetical protein